jgi:hypothetical protein
MPKKVFIVLMLFSLLILRFAFSASMSKAAISSCNVSVSPNSLNINESGIITFNVINNDASGDPIMFIKITSPSGDFVITHGTGSYEAAVDINGVGSEVIIRLNGGIPQGQSGNYSLNITPGGNPIPSASFGVQASEIFEADSGIGCSGDTGVSIISPGQATINISGITVSVTDSTAGISWSTSVNTTGDVYYGITNQYDDNVASSGLDTAHLVNLTELSSSTVYHFQIVSVDENGVVARISDSTFTTSPAGVTTVTTVTVVPTTVSTTTATVVGDITGPVVTLTSNLKKPFVESPNILGKASDSSVIVKTEYSVDGGKNWLIPDGVNGLGSKSVKFNFNPNLTEDNNYEIVVRATDIAGNIGFSHATLIIDRLPPLVGGNIWSIGPVVTNPDSDGTIITLAGIDNKITLSAVGGPISVELLLGDTKYSMSKSVDSGLWSGTVNFSNPGFNTVKVKSIDGAGNITDQDLNSVMVIKRGKVTEKSTGGAVAGAKVSIYQEDPGSKLWNLWDGESFSQKNPQITTEVGEYSYFLPAGTYYLTISNQGYKKVTSKIFNLEAPTAVNANFEMIKGWWVNPFDVADISVTKPIISANEITNNLLSGSEAPGFSLPAVSGGVLGSASFADKGGVIIFINTWLPTISEQISQITSLDKKYKDRIFLVFIEESLSKISVFNMRGGYENLNMVADPDGTLVIPYKLNSLPVSYFVNGKNIIQKIITGVVTGGDMINYLDSL